MRLVLGNLCGAWPPMRVSFSQAERGQRGGQKVHHVCRLPASWGMHSTQTWCMRGSQVLKRLTDDAFQGCHIVGVPVFGNVAVQDVSGLCACGHG